MRPLFDRVLGIAMGLLWGALAMRKYWENFLSPELLAFLTVNCIVSISLMSRRAPTRLNTNLLVWLVVLATEYVGLFATTLSPPGMRLAPRFITLPLVLFCAALTILARINLGRNIGLVPARRELVTGGLYRVVRHPIYGTNIFSFAMILLGRFSPELLGFFVASTMGFVFKALMEEKLLFADPDYAAYCNSVRWRFIPFVF